jgi:hypothetical protein
MSALTHRLAIFAPAAGSIAVAALLSVSFLAGPTASASPPTQTAQAVSKSGAGEATATEPETVEQRITNLHTELKITATEEAKWNEVAQAMRENAATMEKLAAERTTQAPQGMTAVDDLKSYEKFAQAHVDGLKNLIASFGTLYNSFPDEQKKDADKVFQSFGQKGRAEHS